MGDSVAIGKLVMVVILNEVKNLIVSIKSIIEILRLKPQNDITTQSLGGELHRDPFIKYLDCKTLAF